MQIRVTLENDLNFWRDEVLLFKFDQVFMVVDLEVVKRVFREAVLKKWFGHEGIDNYGFLIEL